MVDTAARWAVGAALSPLSGMATPEEQLLGQIEDVWAIVHKEQTMLTNTNWDAYSYEQMRDMLQDAAASQVGEQGMALARLADTALIATDRVVMATKGLPEFWRGPAADNAQATLGRHSTGGEAVGAFLHSIASAMDHAVSALSNAQHSMPTPIDPAAAQNAGPAIDVASSQLETQALKNEQKEQAVAVMRQYERELGRAYDQVQKPSTLPPGATTGWDADVHRLTHADQASGAGTWRAASALGSSRPAAATGSPAAGGAPAGTASSGARSTDLAGTPSALSNPTSGSMSTFAASTTDPDAAAGRAGTGDRTGVGSGRGGGGMSGWRALTGRGSVPGLLAIGRLGSTRSGSQGERSSATGLGRRLESAPGMGAPGAGRIGEDDDEHRNKMPQDAQLFTFSDQQPLAPPVIGDWSQGGQRG